MTPLKLIFMGTPEFAVPTLSALHRSGHKVALVYSQPPRPSGRGHKMHVSPVHAYAQKHGLEVVTPTSLKTPQEAERFQALQPDAVIVAAYGLMLPQSLLEIPPLGCLNVHASLLPRWRGAAPIHRALLAGDQKTGVTIMLMQEGLDTGPMYLQESITLNSDMTLIHLHDLLAELGAKLMLETLDTLQNNSLKPLPQPLTGVTYAQKLSRQEGEINWREPAEILERKVRALNPWPGTWFHYNGERIKALKAQIISEPPQRDPGMVIDSHLTVACGTKALRLLEVQKAGGKAISAQAFLNGHSILPGTLLI